MIVVILILNTFTTWFMTGVIWFVQIVHYPLFSLVGVYKFQDYANAHCSSTGMVVAAPMVIEALTSLILPLLWKRPGLGLLWLNFALLIGIWICTAAFSIPSHERLCSNGYCEKTQQWLVLTNWARTILWTARSAINMIIIARNLIC